MGGMQGQATDLSIQAKEMLRTRRRLYELMVRHTGKDHDTVAKDCERDKWLDAEESVAYGLTDSVLKHVPDSIVGETGKNDGDE